MTEPDPTRRGRFVRTVRGSRRAATSRPSPLRLPGSLRSCVSPLIAILARELRLEALCLELEDDKAPESQVIEEQVQVKVLPADLEWILAPHKSEPFSELEDQGPNMLEQPGLQRTLAYLGAQRQEVERVRVLDELLRQIRLLGRQSAGTGAIRFS